MRGEDWPADELATLTELWAAGYSSSFIAQRMGRTRGAVMGRVHRLGMQRRQLSVAERLNLLAEYLAEGYSIRAAAHAMGTHKADASVMFAHIRRNLGWQAI